MGVEIASFLGLEDSDRYTGHTFRRAAAQQMADQGATTMELRTTFGWTNDKMPSTYIANSKAKMNKQAKMLSGGVDVNQNRMQEKSNKEQMSESTEFMHKKRKMSENTEFMHEQPKMSEDTECDEKAAKKMKIENPTNGTEVKNEFPNQGIFASKLENCQITINYISHPKSE